MDVEPKVEFSDTKPLDKKRSARKTKIIVCGILTLVLFLTTAVFVTVFIILKKPAPTRLVEVKLDEGETLTYQVDQNVEVKGGVVQKGTIRAIVGIRVLNKTSDEYWFLTKFSLTQVDGNVAIKGTKTIKEYFLVRLQITSRTPNYANKMTGESFQVYGYRHTTEELIRHIYGILDQLLPALESDLYEDVDGLKASDSHALSPEVSPLLPGSVKMHRQANTSNKDEVSIRNHFDRADFFNMSSDIDLDLKYSDSAFINKSNGMVTKSHVYFSEQLNFGEQIHFKGGIDASVMKITLSSHISLLETNSGYFGYAESEEVNLQVFVKLVIPKSKPTFSLNKQQHWSPNGSKTNEPSSNASFPGQQHFSGNSSSLPLKRSRRGSNVVRESWKEAGPVDLSVEHSFTVFEKKMIGINVKGEGTVWLEDGDAMEIGVSFDLTIGSITIPNIFYERYQKSQLEDGKGTRTGYEWNRGITIYIPVLILSVGVDFSLSFQVNNALNFPSERNSVNPVKLAVEIEPFAEVTASIEAYVSAYIIRAGVYGDGTLVRVSLPVTLSYEATRVSGKQWCVALNARLTALELSAGIFYQWWSWWWWDWGDRNTLYEFGKWSAINSNWQVIYRCG